jgi:hypothetical protein
MEPKSFPSSGPGSRASRPGISRPELTSTGPMLAFRKGTLLFLPTKTAFGVVHDLHLRSIDSKSEIQTSFIRKLSTHQAKNAYHSAVRLLVMSYNLYPIEGRRAIFETLLRFSRSRKSLGGLESAFFSMLGDMCLAKQVVDAMSGVDLWRLTGPPRFIGGGFRFGFLLNFRTNSVSYFERSYLESLDPGRLTSLVSEGVGMPSTFQGQVNQVVIPNQLGLAADWSNSTATVIAAGCAVFGAVLGAIAVSGGVTAPLASVIGTAGTFVCVAAAKGATPTCSTPTCSTPICTTPTCTKPTCTKPTCTTQTCTKPNCPTPVCNPTCKCKPAPGSLPACGCCSTLGGVANGVGTRPGGGDPGGSCCICGVTFGEARQSGGGGDPGPCCTCSTIGVIIAKPGGTRPVPGCCVAAPDLGAYGNGLLSLGAQSVSTNTILTPAAANALSIQAGHATVMLLGIPAYQTAQGSLGVIGGRF